MTDFLDLSKLFDWLKYYFDQFTQNLIDLLLYIPSLIVSLFADLVAWLLGLVPMPDLTYGISVLTSVVNLQYVSWLLDLVAFEYGFSVVLLAMLSRFFIRRIPGVG